jgi:hypothetical protein
MSLFSCGRTAIEYVPKLQIREPRETIPGAMGPQAGAYIPIPITIHTLTEPTTIVGDG